MGTPDVVKKEADAYVEEMVGGGISLSMHRFMVMELVSSLYRFAVSNRVDPEPIFGEDESLFRSVVNMDAAQLRDGLCGVSQMMQNQMRSSRADGAQTFVTKAMDYVRDNYGDQELTIDKICGIQRDRKDFYSLPDGLPHGAGCPASDRAEREDLCDRLASGVRGSRVFQLCV